MSYDTPTPEPELNWKQILGDLVSTICRACGKKKKADQSFCKACYARLPQGAKMALYKRFRHGYEEAYREALKLLANPFVEFEGRP